MRPSHPQFRSFPFSAALLAVALVAGASSAGAAPASRVPAASAPSSPPGVPSVIDREQLPLGQARIDRLNKAKTPPKAPKLVDINHASARELKTLPGIGDAEAARIIAGRPYWSKAQLVSKNVLPAGPYQSVRKRIVALQEGIAPPKRPAAGAKG